MFLHTIHAADFRIDRSRVSMGIYDGTLPAAAQVFTAYPCRQCLRLMRSKVSAHENVEILPPFSPHVTHVTVAEI